MRCLLRQAALDHLLTRRLVEAAAAGEHLINDAAKTVDVAARIDGIAEQLLGAHVFRCPDDEPRARQRLVRPFLDGLGDAEVDDLRHLATVLGRGDDDVVGLQVAMHDPQLVRRDERFRDLARDIDDAAG